MTRTGDGDSAFVDYLENQRHNSIRTRNVRLTAIRSLFPNAWLRHPEHTLLIQRVLAIAPKRSPSYLDDSTHAKCKQCHRGIPLPGFICAPRTQNVACAS